MEVCNYHKELSKKIDGVCESVERIESVLVPIADATQILVDANKVYEVFKKRRKLLITSFFILGIVIALFVGVDLKTIFEFAKKIF